MASLVETLSIDQVNDVVTQINAELEAATKSGAASADTATASLAKALDTSGVPKVGETRIKLRDFSAGLFLAGGKDAVPANGLRRACGETRGGAGREKRF